MRGKIMKIMRLGHAMYLFKSTRGMHYLVDPFFDLNPGFPKELDNKEFYQSIDCVFLTHGHFDHTSGLAKFTEHKPNVMIVAQYELALILMQKGFENVFPINIGGAVTLDDVHATMVPARHTSSYGETEGTPIYAGEAAGYVFDFSNDYTLYHSGDTTLMADMRWIQDFYKPEIAILSSSGHFTMGPEEAAYAVKNLLDVKYVIPSHTFPKKKTAVNKENLDRLLNAFPVVEFMIDRDNELKVLLEDYPQTEVVSLGYGDEVEFNRE